MASQLEKIQKVQKLVHELSAALDNLDGVEYKLILEAYDEDDEYVVGAEESNNWDRSWC